MFCAETAPELVQPPQFSCSELPLTVTFTGFTQVTFCVLKVTVDFTREPVTFTITGADVLVLPNLSLATAVKVCVPLVVAPVFQVMVYGATVSPDPRFWPSSWNCTL